MTLHTCNQPQANQEESPLQEHKFDTDIQEQKFDTDIQVNAAATKIGLRIHVNPILTCLIRSNARQSSYNLIYSDHSTVVN